MRAERVLRKSSVTVRRRLTEVEDLLCAFFRAEGGACATVEGTRYVAWNSVPGSACFAAGCDVEFSVTALAERILADER
jgi:hypothetical protein